MFILPHTSNSSQLIRIELLRIEGDEKRKGPQRNAHQSSSPFPGAVHAPLPSLRTRAPIPK